MDTLVSLLVLIVFLLVPILPALLARAARKAQQRAEQEFAQRRSAARATAPHPRPLAERHRPLEEYHPLEQIPERPVSLERLPPRISSLEDVLPQVATSLEVMPEPQPVSAAPLDAPAPKRTRRTSRALLERPFDVRRAVVLSTLLGTPRGAEPFRD